MEKKLNDPRNQQPDIGPNPQSIQNDSNAPEDKSEIPIAGSEKEEVQKTFQRKPQFRFSENNRRRFDGI